MTLNLSEHNGNVNQALGLGVVSFVGSVGVFVLKMPLKS